MKALACLALLAGALAAHAGPLAVTVLDRDGKPVADAVVIVVPARPGAAVPPALPASATILQEKMQFVPALTIVRPGARITFANHDAWDHHVRGTSAALAAALATGAGGFELRLDGRKAGAGGSAEVTVAQPGPILLSCHIHGSMRGHIFVAGSPWTARTGADGQAIFEAVPEGTAQVRVWQAEQVLDLPPQQVAIGGAPAQATVRLQVVARRRRL